MAWISPLLMSQMAVNPDVLMKEWTLAFPDNALRATRKAINSGGSIIVGVQSSLYSFGPNGKMEWDYRIAPQAGSFPPALDSEDNIFYAAERAPYIYSFSKDGTLRWFFDAQHRYLETPPVVGKDGTVYVVASGPVSQYGGVDKVLIAISNSGKLKWKSELERTPEWLSLDRKGNIVFASDPTFEAESRLYSYAQDGSLNWSLDVPKVYSPLGIGQDDTIYFGAAFDHSFMAVSSEGLVKWNHQFSYADFRESPVVDENGHVYAVTASSIHAFDESGNLKWSDNLHDIRSAPLLTSQDSLIISFARGVKGVFSYRRSIVGVGYRLLTHHIG